LTRRRSWRGRRGRGAAGVAGRGRMRALATGRVRLAAAMRAGAMRGGGALCGWRRTRRRAGGQGCGRAGGGLARDIYLAPPRHAPWRGTAASRSVARQALPRERSAIPIAATSALCRATIHGATQAFGRARAIGAAKSVSFKKTRPS